MLRKVEYRREPPEGDMNAPTTQVSGADFLAFIVIDDKGNDFFKDLNPG